MLVLLMIGNMKLQRYFDFSLPIKFCESQHVSSSMLRGTIIDVGVKFSCNILSVSYTK